MKKILIVGCLLSVALLSTTSYGDEDKTLNATFNLSNDSIKVSSYDKVIPGLALNLAFPSYQQKTIPFTGDLKTIKANITLPATSGTSKLVWVPFIQLIHGNLTSTIKCPPSGVFIAADYTKVNVTYTLNGNKLTCDVNPE